MAQSDLIDGKVSEKQCDLAVKALLKHVAKHQEKKEATDLLGAREQFVWLQVTVKQMHPERKLKPHRIPVAHPIVDPRTSPVCLITKDPQREYKDLLEKNNIRFISRVVGLEKLKGKFKPFEARRLLLKENGLFLADERVTPLLPGLLGSKFFAAKKQPIPVKLTAKNLKEELEKAISSTYFHQNQGTCTSVKIGTTSQSPAHILANLKTALPHIVKVIKGGWDNIQSLHIKTNSSVSLPVWSCQLGDGEGARWDGLTKQVEEKAKKDAANGKKRAAEEEVVEKPKKKVKSDVAEKAATDKAAAATPVPAEKKAAAEQKAGDEADAAPTKEKKRRHKKKAAEQANAEAAPSSPEKPAQPAKPTAEATATPDAPKDKKRKKKEKQAAKETTEASSTPANDGLSAATSVEDVKQKRANIGVEKKKDKVAKGKRKGKGESAKEALIGVKGLTA
ncbi:ribosomal protein L1 [Panus rudis PR-1116 ss-1]|nr:ribosomal protein L1 [Panus rudis PR-1116 ss-1]